MPDDETQDITCAYCGEEFNPDNLSSREAVRLTCEGICPNCHRECDTPRVIA